MKSPTDLLKYPGLQVAVVRMPDNHMPAGDKRKGIGVIAQDDLKAIVGFIHLAEFVAQHPNLEAMGVPPALIFHAKRVAEIGREGTGKGLAPIAGRIIVTDKPD